MGNRILIRGGHVIDPAAGVDGIGSVMIEKGIIADAECSGAERAAEQVIDAAGYLVLPGLIDFHTHLYGGSAFGVSPDLFPAAGVTAAVDAGTTGAVNFEEFCRNTLRKSRIHLKAFLNVSGIGQPGPGIMEPLGAGAVSWQSAGDVLDRYKEELLGLKIRISRPIVRELGLAPLKDTLAFAENRGIRVNVHVTDPPERLATIAPLFRSGDIFCHVFHGTGYTILDEKGRVGREFWNAKERGVLFDAANGRSNFNYEVAREAVHEGFLPDIISTDATALNYNQPDQVKNLPFVMSKYLSLGMDLTQVVKAVTEIPAEVMGMRGQIGTLRPGAYADVVICEKRKERVRFRDSVGTVHYGSEILEPAMVLSRGMIAYCRPGFPLPGTV